MDGGLEQCLQKILDVENGTQKYLFWQRCESATNAYLTNAPMKQRILPIFNLGCQLREILHVIMLNYIADDSFEFSSSNEEEDIDFIPCELVCNPTNMGHWDTAGTAETGCEKSSRT